MEELCSLLYPCIEEGCIVKQVDDNFCNVNKQNLICLQTPEDDKYIGISIGRQSKMVVIDEIYCDENNKKRFFPNEGIQINHYYDNNFLHNEIKIFDKSKDYTLIINPNKNTIDLTDFNERQYHQYNVDINKIFDNKEDIISFFSILSYAEIKQVLQISNKCLADINYKQADINTALHKIKNIRKEKKEQKEDEEKKEEKEGDKKKEVELQVDKNNSCDGKISKPKYDYTFCLIDNDICGFKTDGTGFGCSCL